MLASNAAFYGMMSSGALQKMIFVYPDGSCEGKWVRGEGPGCSDGLDNNLDGLVDLDDPGCLTPDDDEAVCEEGTFYTKHVAWRGGEPGGRDYEGAFLDMMSHVDQHYRTLTPEVIEVSRPD